MNSTLTRSWRSENEITEHVTVRVLRILEHVRKYQWK